VARLKNRSLPTFEEMSSRDVETVLGHARRLQQAALAGATQPLLRGKNLGLLRECDDDDEALLFRRAAGELGAQVACIRPSLSEQSTTQEVQHTARVLGRLYDALECQGLPHALVQQVGSSAGVPVYDGIASPEHPTARLAGMLDGDAPPADKRRFVLQAVLLSTVA